MKYYYLNVKTGELKSTEQILSTKKFPEANSLGWTLLEKNIYEILYHINSYGFCEGIRWERGIGEYEWK